MKKVLLPAHLLHQVLVRLLDAGVGDGFIRVTDGVNDVSLATLSVATTPAAQAQHNQLFPNFNMTLSCALSFLNINTKSNCVSIRKARNIPAILLLFDRFCVSMYSSSPGVAQAQLQSPLHPPGPAASSRRQSPSSPSSSLSPWRRHGNRLHCWTSETENHLQR